MVTIVIRNPTVPHASGGKARHSITTMLVAIAWLLSGLLPGSASAEVFRWKFKAGEVLHYSVEAKIATTGKQMGQERKSTQSQTMDISWTINSVGAGGVANVTLRYDRVRMRREMPPLMPFEFDSNASSQRTQSGFEAETQQLKAMVGAEITFAFKPTGEIADVKIPEQTLKRLRDAAPGGADDQKVFEAALKDILVQASPPAFPAESIEAGKNWSSKPAKLPLQFATMTVESTFTFQGPDSRMPSLLLVGIDTKVAFEPAEGVTIQIRKQEGKGNLAFDAAAGRVASSRMSQKIDLSVSGMGQTMEQMTETVTALTFRP